MKPRLLALSLIVLLAGCTSIQTTIDGNQTRLPWATHWLMVEREGSTSSEGLEQIAAREAEVYCRARGQLVEAFAGEAIAGEVDGQPYQDISQVRKNRFLLRFDPGDGVVAAAACHEQGTEVDVDSSSCVNAGLATWSCQCFAYTFEEATMLWREFAPGDPPPPVGSPDEGAHGLTLSAFGEATGTYVLSPLPLGVFNSDGELSSHVFQVRANSVWTDVDINADATPDLDACSQACLVD